MSRNHTRLLRLEVNAPRIENAETARQYRRDVLVDAMPLGAIGDGDDSRDEWDDVGDMDDMEYDDEDRDCPQCGLPAAHGLDHCRMCAAAMCRCCADAEGCPVCGGDPAGF
jgi:hypothetical protein